MEHQDQNTSPDDSVVGSSAASFLRYLKSLDTVSVMDPSTQKQIVEAIADLPSERQSEAVGAFVDATKAATAALDQTIVALSKITKSDGNAQKIEGKATVRALFPVTHATKKNFKTQAEKHEDNLGLIDKNWGAEIGARYRSMGLTQSASSWIAIMSSKIDNGTAVAYLNFEILHRMNKKSKTCKGNVPEGCLVTGNDAQLAKEKAVAAKTALANPTDITPLPTLDAALLEKHHLRVSKQTGFLKPKGGEESEHGGNVEDQFEVIRTQPELINSADNPQHFNDGPFGSLNINNMNLPGNQNDYQAGTLNLPNFFDEATVDYNLGNVGFQGYHHNMNAGFHTGSFASQTYFNTMHAGDDATFQNQGHLSNNYFNTMHTGEDAPFQNQGLLGNNYFNLNPECHESQRDFDNNGFGQYSGNIYSPDHTGPAFPHGKKRTHQELERSD
ncbi:hypothetical protein HDK77DRAFT_486786 [Phyllosticta capitalensis]